MVEDGRVRLKVKEMVKRFCCDSVIVILSALLCYLLLVVSFLIPTEYADSRLFFNVRDSVEQYRNEPYAYEILRGFHNTSLSHFSDMWMLNIASYNGDESAFIKAAGDFYYIDENHIRGLETYTDGYSGAEIGSYARYWNGYLVLLKPLLFFFNYNEIRVLAILYEVILSFGIVYEFGKRKDSGKVIAFGLLWFFFMPIALPLSLHRMITINIMLLTMWIVERFYCVIDEKAHGDWHYFFLLIGALTSFFDLSTSPILTFGIPYVLLLSRKDEGGEIKGIIDIIKDFFGWGIGYVGIWVMKWIISSVILKKNVLLDAWLTVKLRTSTDHNISMGERFEAIWVNVREYIHDTYLLPFVVIICIVLWVVIKKRKLLNFKKTICDGIKYFLIALIPFVWYICTANHALNHPQFTYRNIGVSIFALMIFLLDVVLRNVGGE